MNRDGKQQLNDELRSKLSQEVIDKIVTPAGLGIVASIVQTTPRSPGRRMEKAIATIVLDALVRSERDKHLDYGQKQLRGRQSHNDHMAMMSTAGISPSDAEWCSRLAGFWLSSIDALVHAAMAMDLDQKNVRPLAWGVATWAKHIIEQADAEPQPLPLPAVGDATHET